MSKFWITAFFLFSILKATSQQPTFQWAKAFLESNDYNPSVYSNGRSVAVDQLGNVYSAGLFNFTTDFDPGPGVFVLTASSTSNYGLYISKLSPAGDFIWAIQVPTWVEFGNIEIAVDNSNNVYLASELRNAADMDPGPGVKMLTPIGPWDAFVAKYDSYGNLVWAKQFGGPGDTVPRSDVLDIDDNNNVIICGNFNRTVDFDPGPGTFNMTSTSHIQSFIVKLDSKGDFIWAKQFGNSSVVNSGAGITGVKCDSQGNIYTVGGFIGTCDFDPGAGTYTLQGLGLGDGYISKLDAAGQFVWAKRIGNTTNDPYHFAGSWGIDLDSDNNVYTTGHFMGTFDFDPGANTHLLTSTNYDWYVLKLNGQGNFVWAAAMGGSEIDVGFDIDVDNAGNVYTIGTIGHVADMDPGPGDHTITTMSEYGAAILTKLNTNGGFVYAIPFEGNGYCSVKRMVVDNSQNIYFTGYQYGTIDYDPSADIFSLDGGDTQAPFVVKLGKCMNQTTAVLNISTCNSYSLSNETFDSSGTYFRSIPNSTGCDSLITLHLTIDKKFTSQSKAICPGISFFAGGRAQTTSGTYIDTLQTSSGCDSVVTTHLTVLPSPLPNLGADRDLCAGTESVINPGLFATYLWQDMSDFPDLTVQAPGLYWVKVTNDFNCSATDSFIVRALLPSPVNFLKTTDSICSYQKLEIQSLLPYNKYLWSTGSDKNKAIMDQPGQYWLKVTDANGCVGIDSITVFKKDCMNGVYIPNAFTPNNDGKNDVFKALVFGKVLSFKLQVFDRAGQLIFQTTDPEKGWSGINKGIGYSTSVLVWQCFYHLDQQKPAYQKGTVTIIR